MKLRNLFRRRPPKLTGWPQTVDFRGTRMVITSVTTHWDDGRGENVTLYLVDEASFKNGMYR